MPQIIIPLALAAAQAGYSAHKAAKQRKAAKKLKEAQLTPKSVEEALAGEKLRSTASSPEYLRGLEKLNQSSANAISQSKRAGGTAGQIQQSIADTDARRREGIKDLQIADSSFKASSRANVNDLLMKKGGYESEARQQKEAAQSALRGAAEQNEYNAVSTGLSAIGTVAGGAAGKKGPWTGDAGTAPAPAGAGSFAGGGSFNSNSRGFGGGTRLSTQKGLGSLNSSARGFKGGARLSTQRGMSLNSRSRGAYATGRGLSRISPYDYENDLMSRGYDY
jgi:hypothetical protein